MAKVAHRPMTVGDLQQLGYQLVLGHAYVPKALVPKKPVSLAHVRRRLAKIKGSLAQTIATIRVEDL